MTSLFRRSATAFGALAFTAGSAAAQVAGACAAGPGTSFGITAYQCTACGFSSPADSIHTVYSFGAEPVVFSVDRSASRIKTGDVIVAVNGFPITTRAGADQFAYPPANGESVLTLRRAGVNIDIEQIPARRGCGVTAFAAARGDSGSRPTGGRGRGLDRSGGGNNAGHTPVYPALDTTDKRISSLRICGSRASVTETGGPGPRADSAKSMGACASDSAMARIQRGADSARRIANSRSAEEMANSLRTIVPPTLATAVEVRNYGLTFVCRPSCTRVRSADGISYWRFDGYPAFGALSQDGLAFKAGIRDGDVLISVNGLSPLSAEGGLLLSRADRELTLHLEISRDGKRDKITLKL